MIFDPARGHYGLWPLNKNKNRVAARSFVESRIVRGDTRWKWAGDEVRYLQGVILNRAGGGIDVDGYFGPQTKGRVQDLQAQFGTTVDGLVGPLTWGILDYLAGL